MSPEVGGPDRAMQLAQRLAEALRQPVSLAAGSVSPRVSIGVAWSGCDSVEADALVALADAAMYRSKRQGAGHPSWRQPRPSAPSAVPRSRDRRHGRQIDSPREQGSHRDRSVSAAAL